MSFVSGIMMGAAIGRGLHDMVYGKDPMKSMQNMQSVLNGGDPMQAMLGGGAAATQPQAAPAMAAAPAPRIVEAFALASGIKGRRRYRMAALVNNKGLAELLEKNLVRFNGVTKAQANPVTGSLLITYDCHEAAMDKLMAGIRDRILKTTENTGAAGETAQPAGFAAGGREKCRTTAYARSWKGTGSFFNSMVRKTTDGSIDITSMMSLFLLVRGVRRLLLYGEKPSGPTMIWWAMQLMKGRRS